MPLYVATSDGKVTRLAARLTAPLLRQWPLRYALRDELVNLCVELACSGGAQLATRFDLIHVPAERLWLEWDDDVRDQTLPRLLAD